MSGAREQPLTLAEFLAWRERQAVRHEFDGVAPVLMTGGTAAPDRTIFNLEKARVARLAGKPCSPLGPNMMIAANGRVRYPDAFVGPIWR